MPSDRRISNEVIDELLAGASTEEEIAGPGGLLAQLTKRLVERAMEVELTDHVGYEPHQEPPGGARNQRNGTSPKTLITEHGKVLIDAARDRDGSFEPKIVRKRQRRFQGFDEKILALYSRGLSTRDIEAHLEEIYGVKVGRDLISRVTDGVMDDVREWAKRPLEDIYPIVFLDCMVIKVREGGSVQRRALYLALGVTLDGDRDVLGMWFQETEGAKFWMQVLTELKQRGVHDILIACVDGLTGFPDAIEAIFPKTTVQTCIVHLIRSSLKYVPRREREQVARDLKPIYTAKDADQAHAELEAFDEKWGARFPVITQAWLTAWEHVTPFLAFPDEVRRVIYTTDESVKGCGFGLGQFLDDGSVAAVVRRAAGRRRSRRSRVRLRSSGVWCRFWACESIAGDRRRLRSGVSSSYASVWAWSTRERSAGSGTDACRAACPTEGLFSRVPLAAATPDFFAGRLACQSVTSWRYASSPCSAISRSSRRTSLSE